MDTEGVMKFSFVAISLSLSLVRSTRSRTQQPWDPLSSVFTGQGAVVNVGATKSSASAASDVYNAGPFIPLGSLSAISSAEFTILEHPLFPRHSVRIKQSNFCDGTVSAYTGYIDIEARHLFFYLFESRDDPDKDDVIFWTNGGPGGSSAMGLFMELGPCNIVDADNVAFNPYSWNEHANIFFIDQPIGVGFSYAEYGETVDNSVDAGRDIAAFTAIFFEHFTKFKGRAFHLAGESYGGRYLPVFATEVYELNAKLLEAGLTPVNLSSVMIGNGCTHFPSMTSSYYNMQCQNISGPPVQNIQTCVTMKQGVPRCEKMLESCVDAFNPIDCMAATAFCEALLWEPYLATGYNPYDITTLCDGPFEDTLCYPAFDDVQTFLNRADVQFTLGIDEAVKNYSMRSDRVGIDFDQRQDKMFPTQYYIEGLLERGMRVLIYVGANDWICNWVGNERMTLSLDWTGRDEFIAQPLREWEVEGIPAGLTRSAGPLTFATIFGAGHLAPHNKPKESLELVKRWLAKEDF
ncbi:serine carboxypeptidase [Obba rivulosa]|uniref:Carboxypeptidase n=1 Tax=Obba rivulosa TaxID=1052685 RepID=A0A8E2B4P8_9APHY|nr:serine carboxypeptidase [Obba rivulosa]